ncbi:MAG: hypothetical protein J1D77_08560 [Muribaculaceae bacterium]|nr:hypothetical protein [Muribaculaceae bacterium]
MKRILSCLTFILGITVLPLDSLAIDFSMPKDLPTLEALIALHKEMKKNEDKALTQVTTVTAEQEVTTNFSSKYSEVKQIINTKMNDVNSYLILAATITNTTTQLSNLIKEYENFMEVCTPIIKEKPTVSVRYADTQKQLAEETKRLTKSIMAFSATGVNILKASMKEKYKLIYLIDDSISRMRNVLSKNRNYILYTAGRNLWTADVRDIITDPMLKGVSEKLIQQWNSNLK